MTGSGTADNPYIIYDVDDLQAMGNDLTAYYELANDIDASATIDWNGGLGFNPIGSTFLNFEGSLDGQGYVISDLVINRPGEAGNPTYVGLFDVIGENGSVKDLGLQNCSMTGYYAAALARTNEGEIIRSYSTGSIAGGGRMGGLVQSNSGTIKKCYSTCSVEGSALGSRGGGLCQYNSGTISNCYARGNVETISYAAGLLEINASAGVATDCYCTGLVTANFKYGLCRDNDGVITDCFWDILTSGLTTSNGGTGKSTTQMKTESTFTDAGWDLATIWTICSGVNNDYPCLLGVTPSCVLATPFVINKAYALSREEL